MSVPLRTLIAAVTVAAAGPAAAATDPVATVAGFNASLIDVMRQGKSLGLGGRYAKLLPIVRRTHDLAAMTRLVVGPAWTTMSTTDRAALVEAFGRHSTLAYAVNFASFDGERFTLAPKVDLRGSDALVHGAIVATDGTTALNTRLHQADGGWKIVDVYADGISQLAVQRSEFAATLQAGGAPALTAKLTAADDARLKR